jgi:hypothetical protein
MATLSTSHPDNGKGVKGGKKVKPFRSTELNPTILKSLTDDSKWIDAIAFIANGSFPSHALPYLHSLNHYIIYRVS